MILILCHGNINRSPACAVVLRDCGLRNVVSAGFVNPDRRAAKKMRDAMKKKGYDLEEHRSQLVTKKMLREAKTVVYMDNGNLRRIDAMHVSHLYLISLGSMGGETRIPDPAFMSRDSKQFHNTVNLIIRCSKNLAEELL